MHRLIGPEGACRGSKPDGGETCADEMLFGLAPLQMVCVTEAFLWKRRPTWCATMVAPQAGAQTSFFGSGRVPLCRSAVGRRADATSAAANRRMASEGIAFYICERDRR